MENNQDEKGVIAKTTTQVENIMMSSSHSIPHEEFQEVLKNAPRVNLNVEPAVAEPLKPYIPSMESDGNRC